LAEVARISERRDIADAAAFIAGRMGMWINSVNQRTWREAAARSTRSRMLHQLLQRELQGPVGELFRQLVKDNAQYITRIPREISEHLTEHIAKAQQAGARPETIAKFMRERFPAMTKNRIRLIARTETIKASSALTQARSEELDIPAYEWLTSQDSRVRKSHRKMQGVIVLYNDPPSPEALVGEKSTLGHYHAGNAPNCFPGDSEVNLSNGCHKLWKRLYHGPLTVLGLSDGTVMQATPNHPILTRAGWLPIDALQKGDYLVKAKSHAVSGQNQNDRLVRFGHLFDSMQAEIGSKSSPGSAFDFHGDVPENDVDVVDIERFLLNNLPTALAQGVGEFIFTGANMQSLGLPADRAGQSSFQGISADSASRLSRRGDFTELFGRQTGHADHVSLAAIADVDAAFNEDFADRAASTVELVGQGLFARAGLVASGNQFSIKSAGCGAIEIPLDSHTVAAESLGESLRLAWDGLRSGAQGHPVFDSLVQVTGKFTRDFEGHVFNLESGCGWYGITPMKIIAHNCRCPQAPILTLDDVKWPARVYSRGSIRVMGRQEFMRLSGIKEERAA